MIGLGTYRLKKEDLEHVIPEAVKLGYRIFDTANLYKNQPTLITELIKTGLSRSSFHITSKVGHGKQFNLSELDNLKTNLEIDVKKTMLELGEIDLLLLHHPREMICNRILWTHLCELATQYPDIKDVGVSNFGIYELKKLNPKPKYNQIEISPWCPRKKLREYCRINGITVIGHSSLAKCQQKYGIGIIKELAQKYHCSEEEIILKWSYDQGIWIIPRTSNIDHLKTNFTIMDLPWKLSEEDFAKMEYLDISEYTHPQYKDMKLLPISIQKLKQNK